MPIVNCPDCGREVSTLAPACPHCGRPSPAMAAPAAPPAPAHEETLWRGSPSLIVLIGHVVMMIVVLIAIPLIAAFLSSDATDLEAKSKINHIGWLVTLVIFVIQILFFLLAMMKQKSTVYTVTNQRVLIERGILSKSLAEIDLRYIDETEFFQRVTERLLGIGSVTLISSDKVFPTTTLHSIKDPRALRELIRSHAYQVSQRQLFTRAT